MSTPIKPPGGPAASEGAISVETGSEVEGADGAFQAMVDDAKTTQGASGSEASVVGALENDLAAGRLTADAAIEQLVQRALGSASGLPEGHRAALEAQLREALEGDPTLVALQEDLQRVASKS